MNSSFDSRKYNFGELLGPYERRKIVLPRFQRGFSWERPQISQFWNDYIAFFSTYTQRSISASYFLGPIVIQETTDEILVLDGQQRLATATIMLAALRDAARLIGKTDQRGPDLARDIQRELIEKDGQSGSYSLELGELDKNFFVSTIQSDPPVRALAKLRSHQFVNQAYEYMASQIGARLAGVDPGIAIETLKNYLNCLTKGMTMVAIMVQNEDDAANIFETLNDRGLRLSVPDLLLNLLMRRAKNQLERDSVRQNWNIMLQQMGRRDIGRFLRHMWVSKYGDVKTRGLFTEIKDYLTDNRVSSKEFGDACAEECDDYIALIDITNKIPSKARISVAGLLKYLSISPSLPLLLSALKCLNPSDFTELAAQTAALAVRHSLVCNMDTTDLEAKLYETARDIRKRRQSGEPSSRCLTAAKSMLSQINPPNSIVANRAQDLYLNRSQAVWLVTSLANSYQSHTKEVAVDKGTLEHVFPQNPDRAWANRKALESYVWHIGNLTILGERLNARARNADFPTKCANSYCRSEVVMTRDLLKHSTWTKAEIENRAREMAKIIPKVWPGP